MNLETLQYRNQCADRIAAAIAPDGAPTREKAEATVLALLGHVAAVVLADCDLPATRENLRGLTKAALNGIADWLEAHERRK